MDNVTFRKAPSAEPVETKLYENGFKENKVGANDDSLPEPIDSESMPQNVLDVLGVEENLKDLPAELINNVKEISSYLEDNFNSQGKNPSILSIGKQLDKMKEDLGMDDDTRIDVVLDRIGGVVKAWKNIGFISDPAKKRSLFMKLARCGDSKSMHQLVYKEVEQSKLWQ